MSGLGAALSGLVNGFVGGRDVKNKWEDRKDDKTRQKRADELREAAEKRTNETHGLNMSTGNLLNDRRRQDLRSNEQLWDDGQSIRSASEADLRAAEEGMKAVPMGATPEVAAVTAAPTPAPVVGGQKAVPMGPTSAPASPQPRVAGPVSAEGMGATPDSAATVTRAAPNAPSAPAVPYGAILEYGSPAMPPLPNGQGMEPLFQRDQRGNLVAIREPADERERAVAQQIMDSGAVNSAQPTPDNRTGFRQDMAAMGSGIVSTGKNWAEQAANTGSDLLDGLNAPFRKAGTYFTGQDPIGPASRVGDLDGDGKEQNMLSPYLDLARPDAETPARAKAALERESKKSDGEKAMAAGATEAMDQLGESSDMKAAADAVPAGELGAQSGRPMTEKQIEKGSATLMESWRKNGAPNMIRELMRQGRVQEAQNLEAFIKSAEAQKGMELWGKGMFQAQMGDMTGAAETWMDAFNSTGYYDDGYEILKDQSSIIKDRSGNPIGVDLTIRDQTSGETFSRQMTPEDMGRAFGMLLSPAEAFLASQERQRALQVALVEQDAKRREAETDLIKEDFKNENTNVRKIYETIMEGALTSGITDEEAWERAKQIASGQSSVSGTPDDGPPVMRRPQG